MQPGEEARPALCALVRRPQTRYLRNWPSWFAFLLGARDCRLSSGLASAFFYKAVVRTARLARNAVCPIHVYYPRITPPLVVVFAHDLLPVCSAETEIANGVPLYRLLQARSFRSADVRAWKCGCGASVALDVLTLLWSVVVAEEERLDIVAADEVHSTEFFSFSVVREA